MALMIELEPEVESRLTREAHRLGLPPEEYASRLIARELLPTGVEPARSTRDEDDLEVRAEQDMELMRLNSHSHLTAAIARIVVECPESRDAAQVIVPHLCRCSWCRGTLHLTLELCGCDTSHPAFSLLSAAEDWARWDAAGRHATDNARQFLRDQGANVVYARDGALWEEHPDGSVCRIKGTDEAASP